MHIIAKRIIIYGEEKPEKQNPRHQNYWGLKTPPNDSCVFIWFPSLSGANVRSGGLFVVELEQEGKVPPITFLSRSVQLILLHYLHPYLASYGTHNIRNP